MKKEPSGHITESGIPGIGKIPLGIHLCHFYEGKEQLADTVVPYFAAGLKDNQRCIWIAAPPFFASDARKELSKVVPGLKRLMTRGQIEILDAADWYEKYGVDDTLGIWLKKLDEALGAGYDGLRITGNASFVSRKEWDSFMDYERSVDKAFRGRPIVALCSYSAKVAPTDVFEVVRSHQVTLSRKEQRWEVVDLHR